MRLKPYQRISLLAATICLLGLDARLSFTNSVLAREAQVESRAVARARHQLAEAAMDESVHRPVSSKNPFSGQPERDAPNHRRIVRMLKMLAADRTTLGPSDPVKTKLAYQTAAISTHGELLANPDYARANQTILKYELETTYAPLFAQLAATNVDSARLLDLTAEWRTAPVEARALAFSSGLNSEQAQAASEAASTSVQEEIEGYLGPTAFAAFQSYSKGQYLASQVQVLLDGSGNSLTPAQFVSLAELVGRNEAPRNLLEQTISDDSIAGAGAFLSPDQLRAFQTFRASRDK